MHNGGNKHAPWRGIGTGFHMRDNFQYHACFGVLVGGILMTWPKYFHLPFQYCSLNLFSICSFENFFVGDESQASGLETC